MKLLAIVFVFLAVTHLSNASYGHAVQDVYDRNLQSLVIIENGESKSTGVVVHYGKEGRALVVTAAHSVGEPGGVLATFPIFTKSGNLILARDAYSTSPKFAAEIIRMDEDLGLALLSVENTPDTLSRAKRAGSDKTVLKVDIKHREIIRDPERQYCYKGYPVYIVGNPYVLDKTQGASDFPHWFWTPGTVEYCHPSHMYLNALISGGYSGGPVLDERGHLIGIATSAIFHANEVKTDDQTRTQAEIDRFPVQTIAVKKSVIARFLQDTNILVSFSISNGGTEDMEYQIFASKRHRDRELRGSKGNRLFVRAPAFGLVPGECRSHSVPYAQALDFIRQARGYPMVEIMGRGPVQGLKSRLLRDEDPLNSMVEARCPDDNAILNEF